jgi:hydroxyacylglutathione hydrolase
MLLRLIYDDKLAQASYLLGCQATGQALVVDPNRDADQYLRLAKKEGLRITHVTETHIHADFLSGARELAHHAGASLLLSGHGDNDWSYHFPETEHVQMLEDGDVFQVGRIKVEILHTPGHTPEHICFLITDQAAANQPIGLFTGDFVFVGDVGRPDLLEKAAGVSGTMEAGARSLFQSLQRFRELPDYLQVWPGHGAGSACGKALGAVPQTTVGYERLFNPALTPQSETEFIDFILKGQPDPPKYFATMKRLNRDGPALLNKLPIPTRLDARELDSALQADTQIIDTRAAVNFAKGHVPGTINIPYTKSFTNWAGWLVSYERDYALIVDEYVPAGEVARDLALIGLDRLQGYFGADGLKGRVDLQQTPSIKTQEMVQLAADGDALVIDVRNNNERAAGEIPGTRHIPLGYLADHVNELPRDRKIVVHCQAGGRSAIAASVLQAAGLENVVNVHGGYAEYAKSTTVPTPKI